MQFVRAATLDEVLRATPEDEPTRNVVRACLVFGVWAFDREDIGKIGAQLPNGKMGTISSLFADWRGWLRSPDPGVVWSASVYTAFVELLREGQTFTVRPIILGQGMQIRDGRHRLFAAFEVLGDQGSDRTFEIFWDRVR
jgi:hypothetical protein